jgi:hypothetical protein
MPQTALALDIVLGVWSHGQPIRATRGFIGDLFAARRSQGFGRSSRDWTLD